MPAPALSLWVENQWQRNTGLTLLLTPLSWLYCGLVAMRKLAYARGWKPSVRLPVPVIVVGNITVGGAGKTPFSAWLADLLKKQGYRPGIISRGYGGSHSGEPLPVDADNDPAVAGDEPVLLARRSGCPVVICRDRVAAARLLLDQTRCDVIIADDGLQHLRLQRDMEVVIIDGKRGLGNKKCIPSGPLREKPDKLHEVDFVVFNGADHAGRWNMQLVGESLVALAEQKTRKPLAQLQGRAVHAVAGIGNPQRFFQALRDAGLRVTEHPFPDHYRFRAEDLDFGDALPLIMTEKDAVKCEGFARKNWWYLPVTAQPDPLLGEAILTKLKEI